MSIEVRDVLEQMGKIAIESIAHPKGTSATLFVPSASTRTINIKPFVKEKVKRIVVTDKRNDTSYVLDEHGNIIHF